MIWETPIQTFDVSEDKDTKFSAVQSTFKMMVQAEQFFCSWKIVINQLMIHLGCF